jgi:hypothetical protein
VPHVIPRYLRARRRMAVEERRLVAARVMNT